MAALTVSTTTLAPAFVGEPYETSIAVTATGVAPLTLAAGTTQTGKDALPAGLSYTATGRITGTPTTAGTYRLSVKVTDNAGTNTADNVPLTLEVYSSKADRRWLSTTSIAGEVARLHMS